MEQYSLPKVKEADHITDHLVMFVGGIPNFSPSGNYPDHITAAYNKGYLANVAFIAGVLGSPTIISAAPSSESNGTHKYHMNFTTWAEHTEAQAFPIHRRIVASDISGLAYPRNIFVAVPHTNTLILPSHNSPILSALRDLGTTADLIINHDLSDAGRIVGGITGNLVFVGTPQDRDETYQHSMDSAFQGKTIVPVLLPRDIGVRDTSLRVMEHVDQFIADPLPTVDGSYIVAIDEGYRVALDKQMVLPQRTISGTSITYINASYRDTYSSYPLNTVASPNGFIFIEPALQRVLEEQDMWSRIDQTRVRVLPCNLPSNRNRAGMGCKVVIAAL